MKASLKNARISPKKVNLVAGLVRGKGAHEALDQLKFTPKKGAEILYKVLASAVANATNNFKQKADKLVIKKILVTKGIMYKRGIPVSRGRYHPILKRNSNIVIEVGIPEVTQEEKPKKEEKKEEKKETTTVKTEKPEKKTEKKDLKEKKKPVKKPEKKEKADS